LAIRPPVQLSAFTHLAVFDALTPESHTQSRAEVQVISPADLAATTARHDPHQVTASPPSPETGPTVTG
jgi:hypothetical protein